jgi:hypothetical protein
METELRSGTKKDQVPGREIHRGKLCIEETQLEKIRLKIYLRGAI